MLQTVRGQTAFVTGRYNVAHWLQSLYTVTVPTVARKCTETVRYGAETNRCT
jgi:hypothetical protein